MSPYLLICYNLQTTTRLNEICCMNAPMFYTCFLASVVKYKTLLGWVMFKICLISGNVILVFHISCTSVFIFSFLLYWFLNPILHPILKANSCIEQCLSVGWLWWTVNASLCYEAVNNVHRWIEYGFIKSGYLLIVICCLFKKFLSLTLLPFYSGTKFVSFIISFAPSVAFHYGYWYWWCVYDSLLTLQVDFFVFESIIRRHGFVAVNFHMALEVCLNNLRWLPESYNNT